jgi:hypothetical protein
MPHDCIPSPEPNLPGADDYRLLAGQIREVARHTRLALARRENWPVLRLAMTSAPRCSITANIAGETSRGVHQNSIAGERDARGYHTRDRPAAARRIAWLDMRLRLVLSIKPEVGRWQAWFAVRRRGLAGRALCRDCDELLSRRPRLFAFWLFWPRC